MTKVNPFTAPVNVRVYLWYGKEVRLTLRPGSYFVFSKEAPTDEGWVRRTTEVWRDREFIYIKQITDGRDCDGRHSSVWEGRCHVLTLGPPGRATHRWPEWESIGRFCRDYTAEAAGY